MPKPGADWDFGAVGDLPSCQVEDTARALGVRIGRLRHARGWSERELARRSNLAVTTISNIERGMQPRILAKTKEALARRCRSL